MYMCTEYLAYIQNRMCRIVQNTVTYSTSYTYNLSICKFRTNNTCLPKVTGRFKKPKVKRHKRFCSLCNENKLGDEYHHIFCECINEKVVLNRLKYV